MEDISLESFLYLDLEQPASRARRKQTLQPRKDSSQKSQERGQGKKMPRRARPYRHQLSPSDPNNQHAIKCWEYRQNRRKEFLAMKKRIAELEEELEKKEAECQTYKRLLGLH